MMRGKSSITSLFVDEYWVLYIPTHPQSQFVVNIYYLLPLSLDTHCANSSSVRIHQNPSIKKSLLSLSFLFYSSYFRPIVFQITNTNLFFTLFLLFLLFYVIYLLALIKKSTHSLDSLHFSTIENKFPFFILRSFFVCIFKQFIFSDTRK